MSRIFNFSAGPAVLPEDVLLEAQADLFDYKGTGMSIMEMSHRGKEYDAIHNEAIANLKELMELGPDYDLAFIQGGASMQFAMLPMNFLTDGRAADYIDSGSWGTAAVKQARIVGNVNVIADCSKDIPTRMPTEAELNWSPNAAYCHITTNETISGAQMKDIPATAAPLCADMSSDILSCPRDYTQFAMFYAGAQKNLGPSGFAVVGMRKDFAERAVKTLPAMLSYATHISSNSLYNTCPTFGIYILCLVTRWIKKQGAETLFANNRAKAQKLYDAIDASAFFRGTAMKEYRSDMNITFRLPTEELEDLFVKEASAQGLKGLKGHRSVGGIRASIYNAFPLAGVEKLTSFMAEFEKRHG